MHYVRAIPADSMRDEQGSILQLSGVVQDVTERKLRELEREQLLLQLQDKAEQLAQVMRSVPEGVLLLDNVGCVLLTNPRAEEMLGQLAEYADERQILQLGGTALENLLTSPPVGQWHTLQAGRQIFEAIASPVESGPATGGLGHGAARGDGRASCARTAAAAGAAGGGRAAGGRDRTRL